MNKNLVRLYKTSVIILALILFLPIAKLLAHDVTKSPWIFINTIPITEEMENPIPNTSKLDWGEHIFTGEVSVGDNLQVKIDREVISKDLDVEFSNIATSYEFKHSNGVEEKFVEDFSEKLTELGNYFIDVKLTRKDNGVEIVDESIMLIVGDKFEPSQFTVNGTSVDFTKVAPTYDVTGNLNLKFSVLNQVNKYSYIWDFGTGETKEGAEVEYSFDKAKIPVYVVLRTIDKSTNIFSDSFVRLDSPKQNTFEIPRPPVKIPNPTNFGLPDENIGIKFIIGIFSAVLIIVAIFIAYRKRK
ncbi:MAG: hypothetical protein ACMG57_01235 [Candidatus Dojkabacteria bacterium]